MLTVAELQPNGNYTAGAPKPPATGLLDALRRSSKGGGLLLGFDFPIGLPVHYASKTKATSFPSWLAGLGERDWDVFRSPATISAEIGPKRPFYPKRPGGTSRRYLLDGLGVRSMTELMRRCDREAKANPMFWTLGAKQCGRAALAGWHEVLRPALHGGDQTAIWPFYGPLGGLLSDCREVLVETYPTTFYGELDITKPFAKTRQSDRQRLAPGIHNAARRAGLVVQPALGHAIADGFGARANGADAFDSLVGLIGMLLVLRGHRAAEPPDDPVVHRQEGWMLGLAPAARRG